MVMDWNKEFVVRKFGDKLFIILKSIREKKEWVIGDFSKLLLNTKCIYYANS